jgi:hypothetical protein
MANPLKKPADTLYERDFYAWTQDQAARLRERSHNDIDWENVAEEIETVGRSDKKEIRKRLEVLLRHLLKWELQPAKRKFGWLATIAEQRAQLRYVLEDSPSLAQFPSESLDRMYALARLKTKAETSLALANIPDRSPYGIEQILDEDFLPGEPWEQGNHTKG